ncbi:MAG: vanadium-dependent haloperoxidase [Gemmatimonadota bacterium]
MKRVATLAPSIALVVLLTLVGCDGFVPTGPERDQQPSPHLRGHPASINGSDNVVLVWSEACLQSIRDLGHGPPMEGRTLAIVHTAMFDAWAAYDPVAVGTRLGGDLRRPPGEHTPENKEEAISYAAYRALVDLFPSRASIFEALLLRLGYDPANTTTDPATPAGVGNAAAEALLAFRHDDGSNQLNGYADYTGYTPVNPPLDPTEPGIGPLVDPAKWQPLIHDGQVQRWIIPHWRYVTPFALTSAEQFMPPPPAAVRSGQYRRQVQEVINIQAKLTDRQKVIAEYWADGPSSEFPPGHWVTIAQYVSRLNGHTLDEDVRLFFLVSNAVFDASIAAWTAKIEYDYVRPVTAIRYLKQGKRVRAWAGPGRGTQVIAGEAWVPYQVATFRTPPFAEYVSGHSTFSAAAATVLQQFTGSDEYGVCETFPPGWSRVEPGLVPAREVELCWDTFTAAAEEAGQSRLYGGIHFRQGNEAGLTLGRQVGRLVWAKALSYIDGSATD